MRNTIVPMENYIHTLLLLCLSGLSVSSPPAITLQRSSVHHRQLQIKRHIVSAVIFPENAGGLTRYSM